MAYPSLPAIDYLQPMPSATRSVSDSASSVEPLTPEMHAKAAPLNGHVPAIDAGAANQASGDEPISCKWKDCDHIASSPDALYDHLCNAHVGRKSTNNLCLTCGWENCGVKCVKRDHITSHLRVHTPLKPHPCAICGKTFKRPQDLKKHERIHTQEHHQLHKLSKAATSHDPAFNDRVAGNGDRRQSNDLTQSPLSSSLSPASSSGHSQMNSSSPYSHLLPPGHQHAVHKSVSPTPSALAALHRKQHEELAAYQQREMAVLQQLAMQQQQNQMYAAQLATDDMSLKSGIKRDYDGNDGGFDDFFTDIKKRKMEPVYDHDMIERLNAMTMPSLPAGLPPLPSLNYSGIDHGGHGFHPGAGQHQSQSLPIPEIRTEQDLAMFNQFMIQLGREAAGSTPNPSIPMIHVPSFGGSSGSSQSPASDQSPIEDLFNPDELASLGLTGIPGANGGSHSTVSHDFSSSLPNNSVSFGGLYPSLDQLQSNRARGSSLSELNEPPKRTIAGLPRNNSIASSKPSYPVLHGHSGGHYPELGAFNHNGMDLHGGMGVNDSSLSFDSLARSKAAPTPATLAPRDFYKKTYRHVAPLGAAVSSRSHESSERTPFEDDHSDPEEAPQPESRISVRNLLLSDEDADPSLKLPRLHRAISNETSDVSLPPVASLARPLSPPHYVPTKRHTADELSRGVKRLELADNRSSVSPAADDRRPRSRPGREGFNRDTGRRHAVMIRAWLVAVNLEWRRRRLEALNSSVPSTLDDVREDDEVTVKMEASDDEDELEYDTEEGSATPEPSRRLEAVAA